MGHEVNKEKTREGMPFNPLQELLDAAMDRIDEQRQLNARNMRLGQLVEQLEKLKPTACIVIQPFGLVPDGWHSYRGIYKDLALGFKVSDDRLTVQQFLQQCKEALGKVFTGYKGGDYEMDADTILWVANYGECGSQGITGIDSWDENYVDILTEKMRD